MRYVVIDFETNDLPATDRRGNADFSKVCPIEVAALYFDDIHAECPVEAYREYILPRTDCQISKRASEVNGLDEEKLVQFGAKPASVAISGLVDWMMSVARTNLLVGENVIAFDLPVLLQALAVHRGCAVADLDLAFRTLDTKLIYKAWSLGMRMTPHEPDGFFWGRVYASRCDIQHNLGHIFHTMTGEVLHGAHGALADAFAAAKALRLFAERGIIKHVMGLEAEDILA
jgi:DNA polymerase III epsilon subunit-like protein